MVVGSLGSPGLLFPRYAAKELIMQYLFRDLESLSCFQMCSLKKTGHSGSRPCFVLLNILSSEVRHQSCRFSYSYNGSIKNFLLFEPLSLTMYRAYEFCHLCMYSRLSLSRLRLSRTTAYLEEKIWSLFKHRNLKSGYKILWIRGEIAPQEQFLPFPTIFSIYISN